MKNDYNICPFCNTTTRHIDNGLQFEYIQYRECPKCGAIFKNIYMPEYYGRKIIIPPNKGGETDDN